MDSKIQKMALNEIKSNIPKKSCKNCKQLSTKVDRLQDAMNNLTLKFEQQNKEIMSKLAEIKVTTCKLVLQEAVIAAATAAFPITSTIMLENLDINMTSENRGAYVSIMSKLLHNCVSKNLDSILGQNIIMSYNISGSHGKLGLRKYKNFYRALIDSITTLPSLGQKDPEQLLRQALQLRKRKTVQTAVV